MRYLLLTLFLLASLFGHTQAVKKVLVIGIDGCKADALEAALTPNLDALIANGIYSPHGLNTDVTYSGPGWSAIHTGVWSDKHLVTNNSFTIDDYANFPSFLKRIEDNDPSAYTASICHWSPINTYIVQNNADYVLNVSTDISVTEQAQIQLQNENLTALFLHYDEIDGAGHSYGFNSTVQPYIAAIEMVDLLLGPVLEALENRPTYDQEDWLILVTPDHGGIGTSHGGNNIEERLSFFIASGESVATEVVLKETEVESPAPFDCLNNDFELQFDGNNDYIEVLQDPLFNFGANQDFTVECRVKTSVAADVAIVGNKDWDSGFLPGFVFSFQLPNGPEWKVNIGDGSSRVDLNAPSAIADGEWHTLSVSFDRDGELRMYEDGVFMGAADISGIGNIDVGEGLFFGADIDNDYDFDGSIAEVRIWNEVVSDAAIANYACSTLDESHPSSNELIGYWKINEGSGTVVNDFSGNANLGFINSGSWTEPQPVLMDDYSNTPRLVDIPVTALTHLCIPIEESWNLDGQSWVATCAVEQGDCVSDINGDGLVNLADLLIILSNFGCEGPLCEADLNNDGYVNTFDMISIFFPSFGLPCPQ